MRHDHNGLWNYKRLVKSILEDVSIYWGSDLGRQVILEDRWKGGLKLSIGSDEVFICNYFSPSDALISTLVSFMWD